MEKHCFISFEACAILHMKKANPTEAEEYACIYKCENKKVSRPQMVVQTRCKLPVAQPLGSNIKSSCLMPGSQ